MALDSTVQNNKYAIPDHRNSDMVQKFFTPVLQSEFFYN